ncbi:MAG: hypothetical protein KatS3mg005_3405 [Bryobacteraceae bacterium]|nr:MAG: hypothetical protein KatS3mg005_3405 [Bryobacteraceae bacterium]
MGKKPRRGRRPFERPKGVERLFLLAKRGALRALINITPRRWIIERPGWRKAWAAWIYSAHYAAGERLEGRL